MTKEEYLRKVAEMQTDISAIKQEGGEESKTCNACIHKAVCYRYSYGLPENYADKCGDYLPQKSGKWIDKEISNPDFPFQDRKIIECSKCHYGIVQARLGYTNFCPNCGACMKDGRTLDEFIEDSKESEDGE